MEGLKVVSLTGYESFVPFKSDLGPIRIFRFAQSSQTTGKLHDPPFGKSMRGFISLRKPYLLIASDNLRPFPPVGHVHDEVPASDLDYVFDGVKYGVGRSEGSYQSEQEVSKKDYGMHCKANPRLH